MNNIPKVSVVVPVYGVEKYIEQCVRSLFGQTLREIQYIFVDDCSPDSSIKIMQRVLEEFQERKPWVKIIRHEINQGVGDARNHGVAACSGEYVIHCDPDDWVELDMYEAMYKKAKEVDADVVYCRYELYKSNKERQGSPFFKVSTVQEYLNCIFDGRLAPLWNILYKKEIALAPQIYCPSDMIMQEDLLRNSLMLPLCKKISSIDNVFYHYRIRHASCSRAMKMQIQFRCYKYIADISENNPFLYADTLSNYKAFVLITSLAAGVPNVEFKQLYPDIQKNIMKTSLKHTQKMLLYLARKNYCLARIVYLIIHNLRRIKI